MSVCWFFGLLVVVAQSLQILEVIPPTSPVSGGKEVFIRGLDFNDTVKAEFGVNPGTYVNPKSFTNYNGRLTASFITPARASGRSNLGQWVRLTDGHNWSQAVSFFWEDPIMIQSVVITPLFKDSRYQILGSNFVEGVRCALPTHTPVKAKVLSSTMISCIFPTGATPTSAISVISPSGASVTYSFQPTTSYQPEFGDASLIFAWTGAADRVHADYVAIIDAVPSSPTYQQIIAKAELPANLAVSNEPHHMQLVNNQTSLIAGGILSYLTRPQELFFWDITNPLKPVFMKAENTPSAAVDDIFLVPEGGFLVSLMGAPDGSSPGALGEWDQNLNFVAEYPPVAERPADFNPHGISIRHDLDLLVTSDFLDVKSSLNAAGGNVILRDSVRIWYPWSQRKISSTLRIPHGFGLMEIKLIPRDPNAIAYVSNWGGDDGMLLWGIKCLESTLFQALNLSSFYQFDPTDWMLHQPNLDGSRYVLSNPTSGWLVLLDTSDTLNPKVLDAINFGAHSGLHSLDLSSDGNYILVSGYFVNEDNLGYLHFDGDRTVHVVKIADRQLVRADFNVDMNIADEYPTRPHMCRFYNKPYHRSM